MDYAITGATGFVGGALADRLCDGVDGLFHVAGCYKLGQRDPSVGTQVNVDGTRNVLAAAQRRGVPRTVFTSALAVNSDTHAGLATYLGSSARAETELGWRARPLDQGLRETVDALRAGPTT